MATVIWTVGIFCLFCAVTLTAIWVSDLRRKRLCRLREESRRAAIWEAATISKDDKSQVVVRKVARLGRWSEVLDQHFVGSVAFDRGDYLAELDRLRLEAGTRAFQLNAGAVT